MQLVPMKAHSMSNHLEQPLPATVSSNHLRDNFVLGAYEASFGSEKRPGISYEM